MKKFLFILMALPLVALMSLPAMADQKGHGHGSRQTTQDHRDNQDKNHRYDNRDRDHRYDYRRPEHRPPGYRAQPHGRHYAHPHRRRGHEYRYDGHWNSYKAWERYRRSHMDRFHGGRYYRENGHLFFSFCNPGGGPCTFFSIGR